MGGCRHSSQHPPQYQGEHSVLPSSHLLILSQDADRFGVPPPFPTAVGQLLVWRNDPLGLRDVRSGYVPFYYESAHGGGSGRGSSIVVVYSQSSSVDMAVHGAGMARAGSFTATLCGEYEESFSEGQCRRMSVEDMSRRVASNRQCNGGVYNHGENDFGCEAQTGRGQRTLPHGGTPLHGGLLATSRVNANSGSGVRQGQECSHAAPQQIIVKEVEVEEGVKVVGNGEWAKEVEVEEGVKVLGYGGWVKEVEEEEGVNVLGYGGWAKEVEVEECVKVLGYVGWVKEVEVEGVKVLGYGGRWTTVLNGMRYVPVAGAEPTTVQQERQNLADILLNTMRAVIWNSTMGELHSRSTQQIQNELTHNVKTLAAAVKVVDSQLKQMDARIATLEARPSQAAPGCTTDTTKQLNGRIDHVVNLIGDLGAFTGTDTISSTVAAIKTDIAKLQTRPDAATKNYKMPHFHISKFDDYNKTDALTWWQGFLMEASCRTVPTEDMLKALYLQLIRGAQAWLNHLAATKQCTIAELHTHIAWKEFEQLWFTRFMVRNVVKAAMNEVYTISQGSMPTRDWTIKWQKIVTTPGFDFEFS
ncbi:hypothetical protein CBR_g4055 [Chara braunii]|uniref:Uncharacterized protein n=1 Tax=Chara braunii TaxID=69332 RepID=A0A388KH44_CHABU|nr:hypothetical protein CBR_g4055 [Chara braunii]|eukprot:GBG69361.1 hypothetical protein CBR_g4055 [Chara braunii]